MLRFRQMLQIPNSPNCAFCFWNGMDHESQVRVLMLIVSCPTINAFAVFRDTVRQKWSRPEEGRVRPFPCQLLYTFRLTEIKATSIQLRLRIGG